MDLIEATSSLNKFAPSNYQDVCTLILGIKHELENAREQLRKELIKRQNNNDFHSMHEIINLQEFLSEYITKATNLSKDAIQNRQYKEQACIPVKKEKNSLPFVDTDWYTIDQNDVTYKNLHALIFKQQHISVTEWTACYVAICDLLYKKNPAIIERMLYYKEPGIKISNQRGGLLSPKKIEGSHLWVDVHGSAVSIRKRIMRLLDLYHVPYKDVKVLYSDKQPENIETC